MIRSIALLSLLSAPLSAQAQLTIRDFQPCYGFNSLERELPVCYQGERVYFRYYIEGMTPDDKGLLQGELTVRLFNADGKELTRGNPIPVRGVRPLGGNQITGSADLGLGKDVAPGEYKFAVEILDAVSQKKASVERKLAVKTPDFSILNLRFFLDSKRTNSAPRSLATGQTLHFAFQVEGHDRSAKKLSMLMTVETLDKDGKTLMPQPLTAPLVVDDPAQVAKFDVIDFTGSFILNRAGEYRLRLTVRDVLHDESVRVEVPFRVFE